MRGLYLRGKIWWVQYAVNGRAVRESAKTALKGEAEKFLTARKARANEGQAILPQIDKVKVEAVLADLRLHYVTTGQRKLRDVDTRFKRLLAYFTGRKVSALSGPEFTRYIQHRQAMGAANGTINRELSILGTALRLGVEHGTVVRMPVIHLLKEADPRQGFFERPQFEALRMHLPEDLQVAVTIMFTYGWRLSEVLRLGLSQVDLEAGTLRIEPGKDKNKDGRMVGITAELAPLLSAQLARVTQLSRSMNRVLPMLFPHFSGPYKGTQRRDFRVEWDHACQAVGLAGALRHDFRRTAVRNMERAGVPRSVAMKVTGHKTESVYRRYAIVCEQDILEATRKLNGLVPAGASVGTSRLQHKNSTMRSAAVDGRA